jgi:hypothetical protein
MMEAARISETPVIFYQSTWRKTPEDSHLKLLNIYKDVNKFITTVFFILTGITTD